MKLAVTLVTLPFALLVGCGQSEPPSDDPKSPAAGNWLGSCEGGGAFTLHLTETENPYLPGLEVRGQGYCLPLPIAPGIVSRSVSAEGWNTSVAGVEDILLNMSGECLPTGGGQFRGNWSGSTAITGVFEGTANKGVAVGKPLYSMTLQRQ